MAEHEQEGKQPMLDVSTLAEELESQSEIRSYLRGQENDKDKSDLFPDAITDQTVKHSCYSHVHALLNVMLKKTVSTPGMPQPAIQPLREQVQLLYQKCGRNPEDKTIIQDAWCIRKNLGFVKMKTRKCKVSTEPRPNWSVWQS